jgi:hypothetical protein
MSDKRSATNSFESNEISIITDEPLTVGWLVDDHLLVLLPALANLYVKTNMTCFEITCILRQDAMFSVCYYVKHQIFRLSRYITINFEIFVQ